MKFNTTLLKGFSGILFLFFSFSIQGTGQDPTHTGRFEAVHPIFNGFWEYLPRNYNTETGIKYPLLIFMHGAGDRGDQANMSHLNRVLQGGTPRIIDRGLFPDSFFVASKWYKFIVLSPQVESGQGFDDITRSSTVPAAAIDALIEYAKSNYRIDSGRIYLAGLSMGGGTTWKYAGSSNSAARKLAAIVVAAGAYDLSSTEVQNITQVNLPVIATHNNDDSIIAVNRTIDNISRILAAGSQMTNQPRAVYWTEGGHNVWNRTFEQLSPGSGNLVDTIGMTAYNWALQFTTVTGTVPVVWKAFTALADNNAVLLKWTIANQVNVQHYQVERSTDGRNYSILATIAAAADAGDLLYYQYKDKNPLTGETFYRIRQTDVDGKFTYSLIRSVSNMANNSRIQAYPNPFRNNITVDLSAFTDKTVHLKINDAQGRMISTKKLLISNRSHSKVTLTDMQPLGKGMYYLMVSSDDGRLLGQLSIMKQ